jgi:type I restriction enzyme, R subunit
LKKIKRIVLTCFQYTKEDIFVLKHHFFKSAREKAVHDFANTWFVSYDELHLSSLQYYNGEEAMPNIRSIINSASFEDYAASNADAKRLKYTPEMKRQWKSLLNELIIPIDTELK